MKIYTKTGDKGETSLIGGSRVSKADVRIEAYGTVDELNSLIGMVRDHLKSDETKNLLIRIQETLFSMGAILATDETFSHKIKTSINPEDVTMLEEAMDTMDSTLPPLRYFILPGGHPSVSYCHLARVVCRRAERRVIALSGETIVDEMIIKYLNRLSDFFFVLSRAVSKDLGAEEIPWNPDRK